MFVRFKRPPITARFEKFCSTCNKTYQAPMNRRHCKTCKAVLKLMCPCGKQLSIQGGHVYMHLQGCKAAQAVRAFLDTSHVATVITCPVNPRGRRDDVPSKELEECDLSDDEGEEAATMLTASAHNAYSQPTPGQRELPALPPAAVPFSTPSFLPPLSSLSFAHQQCASALVDLRPHPAALPPPHAHAPGSFVHCPVPYRAPSHSAFPPLMPPGAVAERSAFVPPRLPPPPTDLL